MTMKTSSSSLKAFVCLMIGIGFLFFLHTYTSSDGPPSKRERLVSNTSAPPTNRVNVAISSNTTQIVQVNSDSRTLSDTPPLLERNEPIEYYKTTIDLQSGEYVVVNAEKQLVALKNKEGLVVWTNDVARTMEQSTMHNLGPKEISSLKIVGNDLVITFGNAFLVMDKRTGKITRSGSD